MTRVLVHLSTAAAAGGKMWERGLLVRQDAGGITIDVPDWGNGYRRVFFPAHLLLRVEHEGEEWR